MKRLLDQARAAPHWVRRLATGLLTLTLAWLYVGLFRDTVIDDAFISLQYSSSLVEHGSWSVLPGRVSNTATSPLNVLVTAGFGLLTRSMLEAIVLATAVELTLLLFLLLGVSRRLFGRIDFGAFAFVALATNCLLVSTIGQEGILFTLLLVLTVDMYLRGRWTLLGVALGFLVLTRPDAVLMFGICGLALYVKGGLRPRFILAFGAVVTPWLLFSWIYLGSLVPDTLQIKIGQQGWGLGVSLVSGVALYVQRFPLEMLSALALLPFTVFAWRSRESGVFTIATILGSYALLHLAVYSAAGIPPYHWYYVNEIVPLVLVGSLGVVSLVKDRLNKDGRSRFLRSALIAAPAIGLTLFVARSGLPLQEAPIHTNHATQAQYREIGIWIREHVPAGEVVFNMSEMGTLVYYSQRTLVNEFSDPNMTYRAVLERYPDLPAPMRPLIDINYLWRRLLPPLPPASYILVLHALPNDEEARFGNRIVRTWDTGSRWAPRGRQYLLRAPSGFRTER